MTPSAAGFITGLKQGLPWPVVGRLAALSGVYAIEHKGPQQHSYTLQEFATRYEQNFGTSPGLKMRPGTAAGER